MAHRGTQTLGSGRPALLTTHAVLAQQPGPVAPSITVAPVGFLGTLIDHIES